MSRREHYQLNAKYYGMPTPVKASAATQAPVVQDDFPHFIDGDVLIVVTPSRRYKLHSDILRRSSPTFMALLDQDAAVNLSKLAKKKGVTTRWRLHICQNNNGGVRHAGIETPAHVLRRIPLDDNGVTVGEYPVLLGDANENGRVIPQWVLVSCSNDHPSSDMKLTIITGLGASPRSILQPRHRHRRERARRHQLHPRVRRHDPRRGRIPPKRKLKKSHPIPSNHKPTNTNTIDQPSIVTRPIEASLLSLGQVLHRSIASDPTPWLDFSFRLRSKTLWKEALIHGAGRFNSPTLRAAVQDKDLHPLILEILTAKAELLRNLSKRTQSTLLSYYPEALQRTKTVGRADRDSIGRASYANDIMQWLGLTVWRHWIAQQVCADNTHNSADMGFEFFRLVSRAGEAYLDRNQLRQFHEYFPMSLKGESVLENRISELKQEGQGMVAKVLENHSYLDVERFPAGHMTCTWLGPEDYPWENVGRERMTEGTPFSSSSSRATKEPEEFERDGSMDEEMSVDDGEDRFVGEGDSMERG
jgi:hypothetical protein